MTDRIQTIRSIYFRHFDELLHPARHGILSVIYDVVAPETESTARDFLEYLNDSGSVRHMLADRELGAQIRDRVVEWIRTLFVPREGEQIWDFIDQQLAVGRLYAVHVPVHYFDEAVRRLKRYISAQLVSSEIPRANLAVAINTMDDIISLSWSLMKESFLSELMDSDAQAQLTRALKNTLAIVLAGGRGARLGPLTQHRAKPAVPFGGKFRLIDFPLSNCINSGIRRVGVLTQYRAYELILHVQRGWSYLNGELDEFVEVWPAQQAADSSSWYLGTADAVYQNLATLRLHDPDYVLVLAGDHVYRQDYSRVLAQHLDHGIGATVSCIEVPIAQASSFGVLAIDDDSMVTDFVEKPTRPPHIPNEPHLALASMGIYMFDAEVLYDELERDAAMPGSTHDFGKDILPYMVEMGSLAAHRFPDSCVPNKGVDEQYWRDVGTIDAYWEANIDLTKIVPSLDLYDASWPVRTYHSHRPAAKFVFDGDDRRGVAVDSLVSTGCIVSGGTVRRSLLGTNVRVNSHALVEDSIVLAHTDIGRHASLRRCIVDEGCRIPGGMVVGDDAEQDARRFHRSSGGVTLVTKAMLEKL